LVRAYPFQPALELLRTGFPLVSVEGLQACISLETASARPLSLALDRL
jgi:hypothetical protein